MVKDQEAGPGKPGEELTMKTLEQWESRKKKSESIAADRGKWRILVDQFIADDDGGTKV